MPTMTRKNDLICWVYLSENQKRIYTDFIETEVVREVNTAGNAGYSLSQKAWEDYFTHPAISYLFTLGS